MMMWPLFGWGFGGFGVIMLIIMIVFWGLIIWGIVALNRWLARGGRTSYTRHETALEILKRRYASGEITKADFEEKKRDL
jgi:putative membrane protein